jgi:hypothetical protein
MVFNTSITAGLFISALPSLMPKVESGNLCMNIYKAFKKNVSVLPVTPHPNMNSLT